MILVPKAQRRSCVKTRIRDGPPIVSIYISHNLFLDRRKAGTHGCCVIRGCPYQRSNYVARCAGSRRKRRHHREGCKLPRPATIPKCGLELQPVPNCATIVVNSARRAIDRLLWTLSGAMWQLSISLIDRGERRDRHRSRARPTRVALCVVVVGGGVVVPPYLTVAIPVSQQRTACLQGSPRCWY